MAAFCWWCWGNDDEFEPILFERLNAFKEEVEEEETFDACTTARAAWTLILRNMFRCLCDLLFVRSTVGECGKETRESARRKNPIRSVFLTPKGETLKLMPYNFFYSIPGGGGSFYSILCIK